MAAGFISLMRREGCWLHLAYEEIGLLNSSRLLRQRAAEFISLMMREGCWLYLAYEERGLLAVISFLRRRGC